MREGDASTSGLTGPDPSYRPTRISIAPPPLDAPGGSFTLGFATGRLAAEGLKRALAETRSAAAAALGKSRSRAPVAPTAVEKAAQLGLAKEKKEERKTAAAAKPSVGPGQMSQRQRDKFTPLPITAGLAGGDDDTDDESQPGSQPGSLPIAAVAIVAALAAEERLRAGGASAGPSGLGGGALPHSAGDRNVVGVGVVAGAVAGAGALAAAVMAAQAAVVAAVHAATAPTAPTGSRPEQQQQQEQHQHQHQQHNTSADQPSQHHAVSSAHQPGRPRHPPRQSFDRMRSPTGMRPRSPAVNTHHHGPGTSPPTHQHGLGLSPPLHPHGLGFSPPLHHHHNHQQHYRVGSPPQPEPREAWRPAALRVAPPPRAASASAPPAARPAASDPVGWDASTPPGGGYGIASSVTACGEAAAALAAAEAGAAEWDLLMYERRTEEDPFMSPIASPFADPAAQHAEHVAYQAEHYAYVAQRPAYEGSGGDATEDPLLPIDEPLPRASSAPDAADAIPVVCDGSGGDATDIPLLIDEPLPRASSAPDAVPDAPAADAVPAARGAAAATAARRGRITVYCVAEAFDRPRLETMLLHEHDERSLNTYTEVVHVRIATREKRSPVPDAFFFDYGVIITWGLDEAEEQELVCNVCKACEVDPYAYSDIEINEFEFNLSATEPPHIKNDVVTINKRQAMDHQLRLAISHALAQSVKLSLYEERVLSLVEETREFPHQLAKRGRVAIGPKSVARLIGKVFLQSSNVNLLSSVLGTPDFFWSAPDFLGALYERVCEYMELHARVEVLNARFVILQEMLDVLREQQAAAHAAFLELIIIWLLALDVVLMVVEVMGLFGLLTWSTAPKGLGFS
ncbi:hypothetical protein FOA52_007793 [Chlamydomonas sp. UWO 241]|nr:hypothetical protein FOA52_007793 [Chlamydomonas sp. UWO 241]